MILTSVRYRRLRDKVIGGLFKPRKAGLQVAEHRMIPFRLDLTKYQGLVPLYTEYNIGHYARSFQLSSKIDHNKIGAEFNDGVLFLTLPKAEEAKPRTIKVK